MGGRRDERGGGGRGRRDGTVSARVREEEREWHGVGGVGLVSGRGMGK